MNDSQDNAQAEKNTAASASTRSTKAGLVFDEAYRNHITGPGHPDSPERYTAVMNALHFNGLVEACVALQPIPADEEAITRCHDRLYVETVREDVAAGRTQLSTGDTPLSPKSYETALLAAGGVQVAVDAVMTGQTRNAFCVIRPGGHHATRVRGMGFCIFNDVAIAARHAQFKHGVGKVAIIDWDVHHGNGTQDIFYEDGSVFYFDTHQSPWYPGTGHAREIGRGNGKGCILNCPFRAGAGRREIFGAFVDKFAPAMDQFKPELVVIAAGFDARMDDPLGRFLLTDEDFADLTRLVMELAQTHADGRVVSVMAGGYNLPGLASAAVAHVGTLLESPS